MSCNFNCDSGWLSDPKKDYLVPCLECNPELDQAYLLETDFERAWQDWVKHHGLSFPAKAARYFFFGGSVAGIQLGKTLMGDGK